MRMTIGRIARAGALLLLCAASAAVRAAPDDVLARSRATYAALSSYADTGTVDVEFGNAPASSRERHVFKTFYRVPRSLFFDFTKANNADRFVVWSDDEAFRTWWKATGATATYPKGKGLSAFTTGSVPTVGALTALAPWLFPNAGITGTLAELAEVTDAGTENIGGRPCHKFTGIARSVYGATGHVTNARRTTIWIDAETLLVRRIVEDASEGKIVNRRTYTFEPKVNPKFDDSQFSFAPPAH